MAAILKFKMATEKIEGKMPLLDFKYSGMLSRETKKSILSKFYNNTLKPTVLITIIQLNSYLKKDKGP